MKTRAETRKLISRAAYARRRGVAPRTIGKYVQKGILPIHGDKVDPAECDRLLRDYLAQPLGSGRQIPRNGGKSVVSGTTAGMVKPPVRKTSNTITYAEAQTAEKKLKIEILELSLALKKSEMVLVKDVEFAAFTSAREIRDKMLNVPDQISAIIAAEPDELKVREIIMSAIESGLSGIEESYNRHRSLDNDGNETD
jgi:hypothetical protein